MLIGQQLNYNSLVLAFGNSIHNVIVIDLFSVHSVHIQSGVQLVHMLNILALCIMLALTNAAAHFPALTLLQLKSVT